MENGQIDQLGESKALWLGKTLVHLCSESAVKQLPHVHEAEIILFIVLSDLLPLIYITDLHVLKSLIDPDTHHGPGQHLTLVLTHTAGL